VREMKEINRFGIGGAGEEGKNFCSGLQIASFACAPCRGYIFRVSDRDNSACPCRSQHKPTLQQDGSRITFRDRVLLG
jgi:hypothetical protein